MCFIFIPQVHGDGEDEERIMCAYLGTLRIGAEKFWEHDRWDVVLMGVLGTATQYVRFEFPAHVLVRKEMECKGA